MDKQNIYKLINDLLKEFGIEQTIGTGIKTTNGTEIKTEKGELK